MIRSVRRRSGRGYTVAEVLISMTLFAIGAAAVVAMERTSVQGDADARQQDVATSVAAQWVSRLQRDALNWKILTPSGDTRNSNTIYLRDSYGGAQCGGGDSGVAYTPVWYMPGTKSPVQTITAPADGYSFAFDMFGHDIAATGTTPANTAYCAQISECHEDTSTPPRLIQATVRVIWPRKISTAPADDWCANTLGASSLTALDVAGGVDTYRSVSVTVMLQGGYGQ